MSGQGSQSNLNILDISTVFQSISDNVRTGVLTVTANDLKSLIYFNKGNIQMCYSLQHSSFLGEALQRADTVESSVLQRLILSQRETKKSMVLILQEESIGDIQFIKQLCEFQIVEDICDLFRWASPSCSFEESPPHMEIFDPELLKLNISMNVGALLMEAARRSDVWDMIQSVIPSPLDIPYMNTNIPPYSLDQHQQMLLPFIDGERDVEEILAKIHLSRFSAMEALKKFVQDQQIALKKGSELLAMASSPQFQENLTKQIRLFERAEELGQKTLENSYWLAQAYESSYQEDKAFKKYLQLGTSAQEANDLAMASKAFEKAITLDPDYLPAYEKLIHILFSLEFLTEAAEKSNLYAQKLRSQNKKKAVEILLEANKSDESVENLELLATIYMDMGERIDALLTYEKLALKYDEANQIEQSLEVYQKMLEIDEENLEAHLNLANILTRFGRTDEAVRQYKKLADKLNSTGVIKNSFTCLYLINVCNKIMEFEPNNFSAREWLVDAYIFKGEKEKATQMLEDLFRILEEKKDPYSCIVNLKKYITLRPEAYDKRLQLSALYHEIGELEESKITYFKLAEDALTHHQSAIAKEALVKVLEIDPFYLQAHQKMAEVFLSEKLVREAAERFRILGFFYKGIGQYEESNTVFNKSLELSPQEQFSCQYEIGENYIKLKMIDYAISSFQNFAAKAYGFKNYGEAQKACKRILALKHNEPWALDLMSKLTQF